MSYCPCWSSSQSTIAGWQVMSTKGSGGMTKPTEKVPFESGLCKKFWYLPWNSPGVYHHADGSRQRLMQTRNFKRAHWSCQMCQMGPCQVCWPVERRPERRSGHGGVGSGLSEAQEKDLKRVRGRVNAHFPVQCASTFWSSVRPFCVKHRWFALRARPRAQRFAA